jgi:LmbE family N-acetylglucosaminyl deacetylase
MQTSEADVWPKRTNFYFLAVFLLAFALPVAQSPHLAANLPPYLDPLPQDTGSAGLKQTLRRLQNTGRLMMVTAHPDDEDGGVLTLQARGHGVRTVLMTLTRGEGGQNELGSGLFDKLGLIRTLELLASDRYYGTEQRFSRVADFGFSKTPEETFQNWGGKDVPLADMVRVIRTFRPDVLVARFSGTDRDGHAHHQASAVLTKEAFRAAADPNRFPDQIQEGLEPWQPKKLYIGNVCPWRANTCQDENWTVRFDTGEVDPLLGMSYLQMAANGLGHQHTQGHFDYTVNPGAHYAFYKLVDSALPKTTDDKGHEKDFFDGIDTSFVSLAARLGAEQNKIPWFRSAMSKVSGQVSDSVGGLSAVLEDLDAIEYRLQDSELTPSSKSAALEYVSYVDEQTAHALDLALGLTLEADAVPPQAPGGPPPREKDSFVSVSPGQKFQIVAKLHNPSKYWLTIQSAGLDHSDWVLKSQAEQVTIAPGEDYFANFLVEVPANAELSRPFWRRENPLTDGANQVDRRYATLPLPPAALKVEIVYQLAGHKGLHSPAPDFLKRRRSGEPDTGRISAPIIAPYVDDHGVTRKLQLGVTPAYSLALEPSEQVVPTSDGKTTTAKLSVGSNLAVVDPGQLRLEVPPGWQADPSRQPVDLLHRGDKQAFSFSVVPSKSVAGRSDLEAVLAAGGKSYSEGYELITRDDIGSFYYYWPAVQHVSIVDVKVPSNLKVAYIQGAGEDTPVVLAQVGLNLTVLPAEKLAAEDLSQFGSIVLGVRTYDTQKDVVANNAKLLKFVENGGTLVVEHNNDIANFNSSHFTPYPAELGRSRVSVEQAPVKILRPDDSVFHYPNEITQKDFDGWVQERGLYFMNSWDNHFQPLISCHDPNEPDQEGGLLIAKYGKGTYIYSGYSFYRQLPAGVAGAVRVFVNLVSAGHEH